MRYAYGRGEILYCIPTSTLRPYFIQCATFFIRYETIEISLSGMNENVMSILRAETRFDTKTEMCVNDYNMYALYACS